MFKTKDFFLQIKLIEIYLDPGVLFYLESQCNSKPCYGNGYCKSTGDNAFVCICKLGFEGNFCTTKSKF